MLLSKNIDTIFYNIFVLSTDDQDIVFECKLDSSEDENDTNVNTNLSNGNQNYGDFTNTVFNDDVRSSKTTPSSCKTIAIRKL